MEYPKNMFSVLVGSLILSIIFWNMTIFIAGVICSIIVFITTSLFQGGLKK